VLAGGLTGEGGGDGGERGGLGSLSDSSVSGSSVVGMADGNERTNVLKY